MKTSLLAAALLALTAAGAGPALAQQVVVVPNEVDTYVMDQPYDDSVPLDQDITVGETLPDSVVVRQVPQYDDYGYTVINRHRVIVEPSTRRIIKVYE